MDYGLWGQPGVPHKGWQCLDIEDLGEPSQTCEMCEKMVIRYVHTMAHPDWPFKPLEVGCVCAGNMEGDRKAARGREKGLMLELTFARSKKWKLTDKGNAWRVFGPSTAIVERAGSLWALRVEGGRAHRSVWPSHERARRAAYQIFKK